jgi:hypothetical protein
MGFQGRDADRRLRRGVGGVLIVAVIWVLAFVPAVARAGADDLDPSTSQDATALSSAGHGVRAAESDGDQLVADEPGGLSRRLGPLPFTGYDLIAITAVVVAPHWPA